MSEMREAAEVSVPLLSRWNASVFSKLLSFIYAIAPSSDYVEHYEPDKEGRPSKQCKQARSDSSRELIPLPFNYQCLLFEEIQIKPTELIKLIYNDR